MRCTNIKRTAALLMDGSIDVSLGIVSAIIMSYSFSEKVTWWILLIGVAGALSPDIDGLYFFVSKGIKNAKDLYSHRAGLHYPLLYLPLIFLFAGFFGWIVHPHGYIFVAAIFTLASFSHFIHDTFLHGWGIPWLYPFSKFRIVFFQHTRPERPLPKIFIFPIERLRAIRSEYRDPEWYEIFYRFPPHPWMYVILIIYFLGILVLYFKNQIAP